MHPLPRQRRPQLAQPLLRKLARDDHRVRLLHHATLPQRQSRPVHERLGVAAAAVAQHARKRVATMAAHALLSLGEAHPDGAHQTVLVQVHHNPCSRGAGRRQCTPAEGRVDVVRVHHASARAAHRVPHLARVETAAQQSRGRPVAPAPV